MIKVEAKTEGNQIRCNIEVEGKHGDVCTELGALLTGICQSMEEEEKGAGVDCIEKALGVVREFGGRGKRV